MVNSNFRIDSFKIRIPLDVIRFDLPYPINETCETYIDGGEIVHTETIRKAQYSNDSNIGSKLVLKKHLQKNSPYKVPTSMHIAREIISVYENKHLAKKEFLTLTINAKQLKKDYFKGITFDTLPKIVEYLHSIDLPITEDQLLYGELTDVDICFDTSLSLELFPNVLKRFKEYIDASPKRDVGFKDWKGKDNKGIAFSSRNHCTTARPYLKFYSKYLDSISEVHKLFFETYQIEVPTDVFRMEFTIKNNEQFKYYKIGNKLIDVLELSQDDFKRIYTKIYSKHLNLETKKVLTEPLEKKNMFSVYIQYILRLAPQMDVEDIAKEISEQFEHRGTRKNHYEQIKEEARRLKQVNKTYSNEQKSVQFLKSIFFWKSLVVIETILYNPLYIFKSK